LVYFCLFLHSERESESEIKGGKTRELGRVMEGEEEGERERQSLL
jgi:hypothetical protein